MTPFISETGQVALLDRDNVDTDAILPKQFMKSIKRTGFGQFAFDEWRYLDAGELGMDCRKRPLNPDFELNQACYQGASILITRSNFGCGSSREHAPWALLEYGFRAIIAQSFAEIFQSNCLKNGMLTVTLDTPVLDRIFTEAVGVQGYVVTVDLQNCKVVTPSAEFAFAVDIGARDKLLNGWDDIELTLAKAEQIRAFEVSRRQALPWLYPE